MAETDVIRVLLVDDEPSIRRSLERTLRSADMEVVTAADGVEALQHLAEATFDVVLSDMRMPNIGGGELLERIRAAAYDVEVILMTAEADVHASVALVAQGAFAFMTKPFVSTEAVVIEIRNATDRKRLRAAKDALTQELASGGGRPSLVGTSPAMSDLRRLIHGVAPVSSTVLVLGESGTGKELVARAIHERSARASKPFVAVNCGAIPTELVESELFGHVRGAFTSALAGRAGLFEAANDGTLFLDEVGELPLAVQVRLLRTLQLGEIKPVGSDKVKIVDVRVIAATNADLRAATDAGTFRKDLFYRLNVITVRVPPLRERGADVMLLAQHFVRMQARRFGRTPPRLAKAFLDALEKYTWPGNVRELEHAMEHALVLSSGADELGVDALPAEVRPGGELPRADRVTPHTSPIQALVEELSLTTMPYVEAKKTLLAAFTAVYVRTVLGRTDGSLVDAAREAGLDRSNFRRLMRALDVGPPPSRPGSAS